VVGASGAIAGVVVLYALNFPRRTLLFMMVIPMPAWVLGVMVVLYDILGASGHLSAAAGNIAYAVHLAGAGFAFIYHQQRWNLGRLVPERFHFSWPRLPSRKLRVHRGEEESAGVPEQEVDRILEKIHREGEASLTHKERQALETASREYQRRREDR
jgi:hypothetical protein